jgi:fatty-acid desaturase
MSFIDIMIEPPSYGWQDEKGNLIKPSTGQIMNEFFSRLNILKSRKNWLPFLNWIMVLSLVPFFLLFIFKYFTWQLLIAGFLYSMVIMGTHGTVWYHRYCTHKAFEFSNPFWRFITQHLVIKVVPEETYVISHHVHHAKSDQPGDPYNAQGGFLYCFLADVNHQAISKSLSEKDYARLVTYLSDTGVTCNTYNQYQKWGTMASPFRIIIGWIVNWSFWYGVFFLIGGNALACALFGGALIWAVGVRTFNYEGHGKGKDMRKEGMDFSKDDISINQLWPGIVAGEWHNNHHLYPKSARSGFLKHQIDFAWYYIYLLYLIKGVKTFNDSKKQFHKTHYTPYKDKQQQSI